MRVPRGGLPRLPGCGLTRAARLGYNGHTVADTFRGRDLLWQLLRFDSPSGDEGALADWLMAWIAREVPDVRTERLGDSVIARRGTRPLVAIFAHTDTTGFTLGYEKALIPIRGPDARRGDRVRPVGERGPGLPLRPRQDGEAAGWKLSG